MNKEMIYENIKSEVMMCNKCGLGEQKIEGFDPHVMGQGSLESGLMFIAEAPGREETVQGRPLCGKSGKVFEKVLEYLGLTRDEVFTSNTVLCRPENNRDPEPFEVKLCRPFLERQIELIKPKIIITFGRFAANTFLLNFKITRDHGQVLKSDKWGLDIFPLYHPAYVSIYAPKKQKDEFKEDLKTLKYILRDYM